MPAVISADGTRVGYSVTGAATATIPVPYTVRREVDDITALITHLGAPAAALGESSGAVPALEAVLGGAPITKLALYEPPFIVTNDTDPMPADFPDRLDVPIASDPCPLGAISQKRPTYVVLRFQLPHQALAVLYGVDRSSVTRAVHEVRPLLARWGFAVPGQPQLRLRTLADVFAYASACGGPAAHRRLRDPGPPPRPPARTTGVCVRETQSRTRSR
jgi:hypothetical protein